MITSDKMHDILKVFVSNLSHLAVKQRSRIYRYKISVLVKDGKHDVNPVIINQIRLVLEKCGFEITKKVYGRKKYYYTIIFDKERDFEKLKKLLSLINENNA